MGLFNDNIGANRNHWTYKYSGRELAPSASRLHEEYFAKEAVARNKMAALMSDMSVPNNDRRIEELKREVTNLGTTREQLSVFVHEFERNPNKEYELGLGDVTFFELNKN